MTLRNYSSTAAETTLSAGVSSANTTILVAATTGFPPAPFILAVDAGAAAQELVLVTAVAGTTLTVTRAFDSTVASAHEVGAVVAHSHAAIDFREANAHVNATSGAHGATGSIVGTTDAQTLTNKTVALGSNALTGTTAQFNAALTDSEFVTAADPAVIPLGTLGYAQAVANQTGITTEQNLTGLSVTVTVGTARRIRVSVEISLASSAANDIVALKIKEGGTVLQERDRHFGSVAGGTNSTAASVVLTPTAGEHTYNATLVRAAGSGTINTVASATRPAFIIVEDIGAA